MRSDPLIIVRPVPARDVIDLRHRVLREGLPREAAIFEGDDEPTAIHLGAFEADGAMVGCATLIRRDWEGRPAWQLRGMAVDRALRGRGVGALLLAQVERLVDASGYSRQLWCNGRLVANGFYDRHGWTSVGEAFDIPTAGPHFKMMKQL